MAARKNHAHGGGKNGESQPTAVRDIRGWTCKGMVVVTVLTLVPTNFRGSTGFGRLTSLAALTKRSSARWVFATAADFDAAAAFDASGGRGGGGASPSSSSSSSNS